MAQETKIDITQEADMQHDIICAYLVRETETWLGARALADRAIGLDANLNKKRDSSLRMIDAMLDELIEVPGVRDGTF